MFPIIATLLLSIACNETPEAPPETDESSESPSDVLKGMTIGNKIPPPADVAAAPADATTTKSGLAYKSLKKGTGTEHPVAAAVVEVHYTGWTTDGEMFDSSITKAKAIEFPLNGVISGWTEGLQLMTVGEKTRFWIPEDLAYKGRPGAPAGMLVFDVELISIKMPPAPPADVAAPPTDAIKTKSGLAYKVPFFVSEL